ncbi:hypothetical protein [Clostridium oceanicum]|uniref:Uncharacterized protein n=1 Tax=Clostridium oceanicum TaxID=1543 RepID=A0ABP3UT53_9CLOT
MNIGSTTNLAKVKFDTSNALGIKNAKTKEKPYPYEITIIPWDDMFDQKCIGKDGKEFKVVSYYKIKGEVLNKDYVDVFSSKSQGKDVKCYDYYVENFIVQATRNFSDCSSLKDDRKSLKKGIDNLILEMKNNTSKGISNNMENLKTKFNVNGVDFTLKKLMDSSKIMDYARSVMPVIRSGLSYEDYAELGIVKGKINTYGEKNLNKDQQKLLNLNISARVEKIIASVPQRIDEKFIKNIVKDLDNKFYGIKNVQVATNIEYARKIMNTFENVDYSNIKSYEKATKSYGKLITPVLKAAGIVIMSIRDDLAETVEYQISSLKPLADVSYENIIKTADEVRRNCGNPRNIINVCR